MKTLFILFFVAATWGYASAQSTDYSDKLKQGTGTATDTSVSKFIMKAMKSSEMEIEAGRLAQQRAQSADVKAYGARMVTDHTNASNELRPIALKRNVDLTTTNAQGGTSQGANRSGTNVQNTTGTTTGTTGNASTGNNQTTRSAGTTATTGTTTGTTATTSTGNNQTTRSTGTTGTTGTTGNRSTGNDQTTTSAGTTGTTTNSASTANNNASSNAAGTTNSGNTKKSGNNTNFDSNSSAGQAMTDTLGHLSHEEKLTMLKQQSGAEFDRQYMQMMVNDHTKAVKMFEKASNFTDADVRAFATKNLPVLREHLTSAQTILSSLQKTNSSGDKTGNNNK